MPHITAKVLDNGNLELSLETDDERDSLRDMVEYCEYGYWHIMAELFEGYSTNGSFTHFAGGDGNPFVGLTDAPCIAESMSHDDDGKQSIDGRFWFFNNYVLESEVENLLNGEKVIYTLAN